MPPRAALTTMYNKEGDRGGAPIASSGRYINRVLFRMQDETDEVWTQEREDGPVARFEEYGWRPISKINARSPDKGIPMFSEHDLNGAYRQRST